MAVRDWENEDPFVVVEGIENKMEQDLLKHRSLIGQSRRDKVAWKEALSHEVAKKRHYKTLIGGGKYNDEALETAREQMNINIRHFQDKVEGAEKKIEWHKNIVKKLETDLKNQRALLEKLRLYKLDQKAKGNGHDANRN